jgi:hypothetical protein
VDDAKDSDASVVVSPTEQRTGTLSLSPGEDNTTVDAGLYIAGKAPATLGDFVWFDENKDGIQGPNEPGVPGAVVNLYDGAGGFVATVHTDTSGAYAFTGLAAGNYLVGFVLPSGYDSFSPLGVGGDPNKDSDPDPATGFTAVVVVVSDGETVTDIDAGVYIAGRCACTGPVTIGDFVWLDSDESQRPDPYEGIDDVVVVLYDAAGREVARTTTAPTADPTANYQFTGVGEGDYRVAIDTSTLPAGVTQFVDPDGYNDDETELLDVRFTDLRVDFGYEQDPPDLAPTITIDPNVMLGPTNFSMVVRVAELQNVATSGLITVFIPKDPRWNPVNPGQPYDSTATSIGGVAVDNASWTYSDGGANHVFSRTTTMAGGTVSSFGMNVTWDAGQARGNAAIAVQIVGGSGGEDRFGNNTDVERLDYFIQ